MLQKIATCLSLSLLLTSAVPMPAIMPTSQAEALSAAMWTHGSSVQVQNPEDVTVTQLGFYTRVDGKSSRAATWFHFAIPTPVILSDVHTRLNSVLLQFYSVMCPRIMSTDLDGLWLLAEWHEVKLSYVAISMLCVRLSIVRVVTGK